MKSGDVVNVWSYLPLMPDQVLKDMIDAFCQTLSEGNWFYAIVTDQLVANDKNAKSSIVLTEGMCPETISNSLPTIGNIFKRYYPRKKSWRSKSYLLYMYMYVY
ncbi:MAG: hypothetical protein V2I33_22515 [Kangiellaceae bacterium]|jgi:hypothetical protein|nr:hypothetical protein [Kangiellaceae bacterium]